MKILIQMFSRKKRFQFEFRLTHFARESDQGEDTVFPDYSESELYKRIVRTDTPPPEVFR